MLATGDLLKGSKRRRIAPGGEEEELYGIGGNSRPPTKSFQLEVLSWRRRHPLERRRKTRGKTLGWGGEGSHVSNVIEGGAAIGGGSAHKVISVERRSTPLL